ncbi:MAG: head GIN domain-containing protein [Saprospiraceae bacterium]
MKNVVYLLIVSTLMSCDLDSFNCYDGSIITKELSLNTFHKIDIDFSCEVILVVGDEQKIVIEGKDDMIQDLENRSIVSNDTWKVRTKGNCILPTKDTRIYITVPGLKELSVDGNYMISSEGLLKNVYDALKIDLDGNGDLSLSLDNLVLLELEIDGNSKVDIEGVTNRFNIDCDGNSEIRAHDFWAEIIDIKIDGNANMDVNASQRLIVNMDGKGSVCYKGNPQITSNQEGSSRIKNCN